jgi:hypothetical protein
MLAVVVNHGHNAHALALRDRLTTVVDAVAIDSGSQLTHVEHDAFDVCLPNVYYSGLLNEAVRQVQARGHDSLLLVASDVRVEQVETLVTHARSALARPDIGVYGPCCAGAGQRHMWPRRTARLREVPFLEGFCFAARADLLSRLCPVDLERNRLGWGLDVHLGYLALRSGLRCVVDDQVEVMHPARTGYSLEQARREYVLYKRTHGLRAFSLLIDWLRAEDSVLGARLVCAAMRA